MNHVAAHSFLTLHYRLSGTGGDVFLDTFNDKPATLSMGQGELASAIEARLVGLAEGDNARFELPPGAAFGERNPELLQHVARSLLDKFSDSEQRYEVGDVVQFPTPSGGGGFAGVVQEVGPQSLLFDFNHPLAGRAVIFEVQLIGVL